MLALSQISAREALAVKDQLIDVYRAAFSPHPYNKTLSDIAGFSATFGRHTERQGFKCVVLRPEPDPAASVAGFAYGYTSQRGQWWHDIVAEALGPALEERWLSDCFELVELALHPAYQGMGWGGRLHDSLLRRLPHATAALSTLQSETAALHLYQKRGWVTVVADLRFPNTRQIYRIMVKELCRDVPGAAFSSS